MGWVVAPVIPGFESIMPNWTWEGPVPDILPPPPEGSPGQVLPVPSAPVLAPASTPGMSIPAPVTLDVPAIGAAAPGLIPGLQAAYYAAHPESAPSTTGDDGLGMLLLLGLGAYAVSKVKWLRL